MLIDELIEIVNEEFNGILRASLYEIGLSDEELSRLRVRKKELRNALKNTGIGDNYAKKYVKAAIRKILEEKIKITEEQINEIISFDRRDLLSHKDKFDILLYIYKEKNGFHKAC